MVTAAVRRSKLRWTILRLTYIVSPRKLAMDPLMFEMPLDTPLEVCTAEDAGLALARATISDCLLGTTANLAGGERCRTTYSEYLDHMTEAFGLGTGLLPECAFGPGPFHCAYMDTREAQRALEFQHHTLDDYYVAVRHAMRFKRPVLRVLRPLIRASLLRKSPYRKQATRQSPAHFGSLAGGRRVSPSH